MACMNPSLLEAGKSTYNPWPSGFFVSDLSSEIYIQTNKQANKKLSKAKTPPPTKTHRTLNAETVAVLLFLRLGNQPRSYTSSFFLHTI